MSVSVSVPVPVPVSLPAYSAVAHLRQRKVTQRSRQSSDIKYDLKAREARLRDEFARRDDLTFLFWFSSSSPSDDAYLAGGNGPSGYIADLLGGSNALKTEAEWPALGWEGIMASDPTVIVAAQVDRERWALDEAQTKINFLTSDPAVSQMEAVKAGRIAVISGSAMNPSVHTLYGAEQLAQQLRSFDLK